MMCAEIEVNGQVVREYRPGHAAAAMRALETKRPHRPNRS